MIDDDALLNGLLSFTGHAADHREKGRDLTQSYDKSLYTHRKNNVGTQKTPTKTTITQRLRADFGCSVGVTAVTTLVVEPINER